MKNNQLVEQTNKNLTHFSNTYRTIHRLSRYSTITEKGCEQAIGLYHKTFDVLKDSLADWTDYVGYTGLGDTLSSISEEVSHIERDLELVKLDGGKIHLEELTDTYEEVIDNVQYYSAMVFCIPFRSFASWLVDNDNFDYNKSVFRARDERAFIYSIQSLTRLLGKLNGFIRRYHRQCEYEAIKEKEKEVKRNEVVTNLEGVEYEIPPVTTERKSLWQCIKGWLFK